MDHKLQRLKRLLKSYDGLVLAYSGGVDSSFLMCVAAEVLKNRLVCVTAASPLYPQEETRLAKNLAKRLKVKHRVIHTHELANERFASNPRQRCYFCKKELFLRLKKIGSRYGYAVADASNYSDRNDFRPGTRAAAELGVKSPLSEVKMTKSEIRRFARKYGLPNWNKPAMACLASRIPYGKRISRGLVAKIRQAENFLKNLGFEQLRVRHHDLIARIETEPKQFGKFLKSRQKIIRFFERLGYKYVTLDLTGYVTGSMNKSLR